MSRKEGANGLTPSQTVGPFFAYGLVSHGAYDWPDAFSSNLVTADTSGERIRIEGTVFDGDGEPVPVPDVAASFQEAVVDVLTSKALDACRVHGVDHLLIGGGVAANSRLRALSVERAADAGVSVRIPRPGLCTDNGAMVAALGATLIKSGVGPSALDLGADSSLPITTVAVQPDHHGVHR